MAADRYDYTDVIGRLRLEQVVESTKGRRFRRRQEQLSLRRERGNREKGARNWVGVNFLQFNGHVKSETICNPLVSYLQWLYSQPITKHYTESQIIAVILVDRNSRGLLFFRGKYENSSSL